MENKKSGLGIIAFILGIIGFLTGFIAIGILFDFLAIILGLVCIISKKQKSGFGIAGLTIGLLGIILTFFIFNLFNSSDDNVSTITNSDISLVTTESNENIDVDLSSQIVIDGEYFYENSIQDTLHYLVITNNSKETIVIDSNVVAYNSNDEIIGSSSGELRALGSGNTSILNNYFSNVSDAVRFEYTLNVKEDPYYESILDDVTFETSVQSDKVIVTCMNNGDKPAQFVSAYGLFFKNGKLVYGSSMYAVDGDSEIKPGKTISTTLDCYQSFDNVEIYIDGRR